MRFRYGPMRIIRTGGVLVSVTGTAGDLRTNVYRRALGDVCAQADDLLHDAGAVGRNPVAGVAAVIADAWTASGSTARAAFLADLTEAGLAWRGAVVGLRDDADARRDDEPVQIDVEAQPHLRWKTEQASLSARSRAV